MRPRLCCAAPCSALAAALTARDLPATPRRSRRRQRQRARARRRPGAAPLRCAARRARPHRHQDRLPRRRLRRLHGAARRRAGLLVHRRRRPVRRTTVTTVEGLAAADGSLSALQRAFVAHGAAQCGICTPGMLMSAESLLRANPRPSEAEVRGRARRRALPLHRLPQDRRGGARGGGRRSRRRRRSRPRAAPSAPRRAPRCAGAR